MTTSNFSARELQEIFESGLVRPVLREIRRGDENGRARFELGGDLEEASQSRFDDLAWAKPLLGHLAGSEDSELENPGASRRQRRIVPGPGAERCVSWISTKAYSLKYRVAGTARPAHPTVIIGTEGYHSCGPSLHRLDRRFDDSQDSPGCALPADRAAARAACSKPCSSSSTCPA